MKNVLAIVCIACFALMAKGQEIQLSGSVTDTEKQALPFANVVLMQTDSTFVAGTTTDAQGEFQIATPSSQKNLLLKIQLIGYETLYRTLDAKSSRNIGQLQLEQAAYALKDVEVTGKSPVVKREADKIVFDPKNTAGAINATDLLGFTPGVIVDGDDVKLFNMQGVKFYINGREQKLSSKEMLQMLKSYPASDVDKIELITNPSAKYAANETGGIINIKLKKKENNYVGGSVSFAHTQYEKWADELNANVIYNQNKVAASVNVGGDWRDTPYEETNYQDFSSYRKSVVDDGLIGKRNYFARGQLDYTVNDNWTLGLYAYYNHGKRDLEIDGRYDFTTVEQVLERYSNARLDRDEKTDTYSFNLNAEQRIGNEGKTIWYNFDYYRLNFNDDTQSSSLSYSAPQFDNILYENYQYANAIGQTIDNLSGKVDATLPFGKNRINVGTHFSYTQNDRDFGFHTELTDEKPLQQTDKFTYDEYVWALYSEYKRQFSDKWSMNLGLRMEATWTEGRSHILQTNYDRSYVDFFPSFFLGYNPNQSHSLNFSVSSSVTRPNINNVNPNPVMRSRYLTVTGNPLLKPSYFYKGMIGYTFKGILNFDLYYFSEPNKMSSIDRTTSDMMQTTTWENSVDAHSAGINSFYYFDKLKWLTLILMQGVDYQKTKSTSAYTLPEESRVQYNAILNAQFFFDANRRFMATLTGNFSSKEKTVTTEIDPLYRMDVGLQYSLLKDRLQLGLTCYNVLASKIKGTDYSGGVAMHFNNKFNYLKPRLSITYSWGAGLREKHHDFETKKIDSRVVNDF